MRDVHNGSPVPMFVANGTECSQCRKKYTKVGGERHWRLHAKADHGVCCTMCPLRFVTAVEARSHITEAHGSQFGAAQLRYQCGKCDRDFDSAFGDWNKHRKMPHTIDCEFCNATF